jgi:hypothetical protein
MNAIKDAIKSGKTVVGTTVTPNVDVSHQIGYVGDFNCRPISCTRDLLISRGARTLADPGIPELNYRCVRRNLGAAPPCRPSEAEIHPLLPFMGGPEGTIRGAPSPEFHWRPLPEPPPAPPARRSDAAPAPLTALWADRGFTPPYEIPYHGLKLPRVSTGLGCFYLRRGADLPQVGGRRLGPALYYGKGR